MQFVFSFGNLNFYFNGTNLWAVEKGDDYKGMTYIDNEQSLMRSLPILQMKYDEFLNEIHKGISMHFNDNQVTDVANTFPLYNILCAAIFSDSEYWVKLALHWVPFVSFNLREELIKASMNNNYSQSVRHNAKKLAYAN